MIDREEKDGVLCKILVTYVQWPRSYDEWWSIDSPKVRLLEPKVKKQSSEPEVEPLPEPVVSAEQRVEPLRIPKPRLLPKPPDVKAKASKPTKAKAGAVKGPKPTEVIAGEAVEAPEPAGVNGEASVGEKGASTGVDSVVPPVVERRAAKVIHTHGPKVYEPGEFVSAPWSKGSRYDHPSIDAKESRSNSVPHSLYRSLLFQRYPAKVLGQFPCQEDQPPGEILYQIIFYDGFERKVHGRDLRLLPPEKLKGIVRKRSIFGQTLLI